MRDVSFLCAPGIRYALLGPNGSGKTTTMRLLATLLRPDAGSLMVAGCNLAEEPGVARTRIGYVAEDAGLDARLTVREVLAFAASVRRLDNPGPRIGELAGELGFAQFLDRRCGALSQGNRQKVAIARAVIHEPPVLLLDEPTANLDVEAAAATEALLASAHVGNRCLIVSTHRLDEAERLCERVIGLQDGEVFLTAAVEDVAAEASGEPDFRRGFLACLNARQLANTAA